MEGFTPVWSVVGGILIGLAAISLLLSHGRIAGISGIISGVLHPEKGNTLWRAIFLSGLFGGAILIRLLHPEAMQIKIDVSAAGIILAGFLVGIGTRIGNGCTSGHGVCGIGRLSIRSMVAVMIFFGFAVLSTWITRHVMEGL